MNRQLRTLLNTFVRKVGACALSATVAGLVAQTVPPPSPAANSAAGEETVVLSPFEVSTTANMGYESRETLGGTRLRTELKDIASQISIMTPEFLSDLGVTSLDDALRYSLNTDVDSDILDLGAVNTLGSSQTTLPLSGGGRTRNIGSTNRGHDFFATVIPLQTYNTEGFTIASGPNAVLFGNSRPAGSINAEFKKAELNRARSTVTIRVDSENGYYFTPDFNMPIVKGKLAVRLVGLRDRKNDWRDGGHANQDRLYGAVRWAPTKKLTLRGYYEIGDMRTQPVRNTLLQDHVSPWIAAGKPDYPNFVRNATTGVWAFNTAGVPNPPAVGQLYLRNNTQPKPFYFFDRKGFVSFGQQQNIVFPLGFDSNTAAPNNWEHSVIDKGLYPYDVAFAGNAIQTKQRFFIRGAAIEFNPIKKLYFELAVNQEERRYRTADLMNNAAAELNVDGNRYLSALDTAGQPVPNPNVGRFYLQNITSINSEQFHSREQGRLSTAYELDFSDRPGRAKWLGRHRAAFAFESYEGVNMSQRQDLRLISEHAFMDAAATRALGATQRQINFRYYLPVDYINSADAMKFRVPFDPLASGPSELRDNNGNVVGTIAGFDSPLGASDAVVSSKTRVDSRVFALQSNLLNWGGRDRIAFTYGRRSEDVRQYSGRGYQSIITPRTTAGGTDVPLGTSYNLTGNEPLASVLARGGPSWARVNSRAPKTDLKGIVLHTFKWLDLHYSESNAEETPGAASFHLDGTVVQQGVATGKDYGLSLRLFDGRVVVRANRFENVAQQATSALANLSPVPTATGGPTSGIGNDINLDVLRIEKSIYVANPAAFPYSANYRPYQEAIIAFANPPGYGGVAQDSWNMYSDRKATGTEVEVAVNLTPAWTVRTTYFQGESKESNVGPDFFDFIQERLPIWARAENRNIALGNPNNFTVATFMPYLIQNLNYIRLAQGNVNTLEYRRRIQFQTRYEFREGSLKGVRTGASASWRSAPVIGYPQMQVTDNPYKFADPTGVDQPIGSNVSVSDIFHPIYGRAVTTLDAWAGYSRRILQNKVGWSVQLNVRNLLNDRRLIPQRATSAGDNILFSAPEPRLLMLTNTFSF